MSTARAAPSIEIAGRQVGGGAPAYLIAEVAQAHDGSLGLRIASSTRPRRPAPTR